MVGHLGFPLETVAVFVVLSVGSIFIDLHAHKSDEPPTLKNAAMWSLFWVGVSVLFGIYLHIHHGAETASLFFTGYALEKVLSVDNLFLMMAVFSWFKVPEGYRHRVLYWGVIGAIVFRMIFVALGAGLMAMMGAYVELLFAAVVGFSAVAMLRHKEEESEEEADYSEHLAYRWVHKLFPVFPRMYGHRFFLNEKELAEARTLYPDAHLELAGEDVKHPENSHPKKLRKGALVATPLFLCLAVIELSDVMFAFDSVPAVIAVSKEPLIVYSAMMFAIGAAYHVFRAGSLEGLFGLSGKSGGVPAVLHRLQTGLVRHQPPVPPRLGHFAQRIFAGGAVRFGHRHCRIANLPEKRPAGRQLTRPEKAACTLVFQVQAAFQSPGQYVPPHSFKG